MPHQQNPDRGPGSASPGAPERPRAHGHRIAAPDAPHLPRQRHQVPSRPPANATPPGGQPRTGPATPPAGAPSPPRPTRMMPGPGTPEPAPTRVTPVGSPGASGPSGPSGDGPRTTVAGADDGAAAATTATADPRKKEGDLSFNKIAAGAGAAVVTAVLGSFLGAVGTILGAAIGSIVTTFATTLFQRSIERTRTQVADRTQKMRERQTQRGGQGAAVWQAAARDGGPSPDPQETVRIDPSAVGATSAPTRTPRRFRMSRKSIILSVVGAVLAFGVAMFLITGVEWIKGSTITGGGSGTSIGNVVQGSSQQQDDQQSGDSTSTSESATSTSESTSESGQSTSTSDNGGSDSDSSTSDPLQDGLNRVLPSQSPQSGQLQSGQNGGANTGSGGANSTN